MKARLQSRNALTEEDVAVARRDVDTAKVALGESGPVWWDDGSEDVSGCPPEDTPYGDWWRALSLDEHRKGSE